MEVAEKGDKKVTKPGICQKYPVNNKLIEQRKAAEAARHLLADRGRFINLAMRRRLTPHTEVMEKGQKHQRITFPLPWVIKALDGGDPEVVDTKEKAKYLIDIHTRKGSGCQVQEYLQGYTFAKVEIQGGRVVGDYPLHVIGKVSRLITFIVMMGVNNFVVTVAYNADTSYIIGAKLT